MFPVSPVPIYSRGSVSGSVCLSVTVGSLKLVSGSRGRGVLGQACLAPAHLLEVMMMPVVGGGRRSLTRRPEKS